MDPTTSTIASDTATQICVGAVQVAVVLAALFVVWVFGRFVELSGDNKDGAEPRIRLVRRDK